MAENETRIDTDAVGRRSCGAQTVCKRCGKPFEPRLLKEINVMSSCCEDCGVRNILDALGLPTWPGLLDPHSRRPCLTDREFQSELRKPRNTRNTRKEK